MTIKICNYDLLENEEQRKITTKILEKFCENRLKDASKDFYLHIRESFSTGYTGSIVLSVEYGYNKPNEDSIDNTYRVLKLGKKELLQIEYDGYINFDKKGSDFFCSVEKIDVNDDYEINQNSNHITYSILVYKDVKINSSAISIKAISRYIIDHFFNAKIESYDPRPIGENLRDVLNKLFTELKKKIYDAAIENNISYRDILKNKIKSSLTEEMFDKLNIEKYINMPRKQFIDLITNLNEFYIANYIHGDMNPNNVLLCIDKNGLDINTVILIDYGEVINKKNENFTFVFWDIGRLIGGIIQEFIIYLKKTTSFTWEEIYDNIDKILSKIFNKMSNQEISGIWEYLYYILLRILEAFFARQDNSEQYNDTKSLNNFIGNDAYASDSTNIFVEYLKTVGALQ